MKSLTGALEVKIGIILCDWEENTNSICVHTGVNMFGVGKSN